MLFLVIKNETKRTFYLYAKEIRIRNYAAITISSYMYFLKLLLNYLSSKNIKKLSAHDRTRIFKMTALKFSLLKEHEKYNLIIADPPFFKDDIYKVVENILFNKYLADEGIMIIERSVQTKGKDIKNFNCEPFKIIGDSCLYELKNN
ncbi:MAG: RsmD family RNA methyltransferase [Bacteroidetes bacterium]|nr:RsmD family RNA methyltransferase [Bacteroidota bacterium]